MNSYDVAHFFRLYGIGLEHIETMILG